MSALLLPLTLALVLPAEARSLPPAGTASATGVVEVPLLAGPGKDDPYFYVEATAGDQTLLLRVETGHNVVTLSEAAAGRLGVKVSKGSPKKAVVDTIQLGGATLSGVKLVVDAVPDSGGIPVDGAISLAAFPDLSWAFLPSAGLLKIAPADQGAALVSALGGTPFPTADFAALSTRAEKVGTEKVQIPEAPISVPVDIGGIALPMGWEVGHTDHGTTVCRELDVAPTYTMKGVERARTPLPAAPGLQVGEARHEWRTLGVSGASVEVSVVRDGCGASWFLEGVTQGKAGVDLAGRFDLAVDAAGHTAALKPAGAVKRGDAAAAYEARLKKAVDEAGKDATEAEAKADARRGALGPLADFLHARGQLEAEIPLRKEIAEGDADVCTHWVDYGVALLDAGRATEAADAFTRADGLYAPWAGIALADRLDQQARYDKAEKRGEAWEGTVPQAHACHVAPGLLATARLQQKDAAGVAALYPSRLDLDARLPTVAGIAALRAGDLAAAQAAFRQAERVDGAPMNPNARVGLFLATRSTNLEQARAQLEAIHFQVEGRTDPLAVELYGAALRPSGKAVAALQAAVDATPGDAVLLTQLGVEQGLAGDAGGAAKSFAAADTRFKAALAGGAGGATLAEYAWFLSASGKPADARPLADQASKLRPDSGLVWLVMARAEGDSARAAEYLARAQRVWAANPGYALLVP